MLLVWQLVRIFFSNLQGTFETRGTVQLSHFQNLVFLCRLRFAQLGIIDPCKSLLIVNFTDDNARWAVERFIGTTVHVVRVDLIRIRVVYLGAYIFEAYVTTFIRCLDDQRLRVVVLVECDLNYPAELIVGQSRLFLAFSPTSSTWCCLFGIWL